MAASRIGWRIVRIGGILRLRSQAALAGTKPVLNLALNEAQIRLAWAIHGAFNGHEMTRKWLRGNSLERLLLGYPVV